MTEKLVEWFSDYQEWAILISFTISLIIHIIGVIPSLFITTANILAFGPIGGGLLSFLGEVSGSLIAFWLYRAGIRKINFMQLSSWKWLQPLSNWSQLSLFYSVLFGRLIPFIPSVIVNMFASVSRICYRNFFFATFLGKIPAMLFEVLISYDFIHLQENYLRFGILIVIMGISYGWFWRFQKSKGWLDKKN